MTSRLLAIVARDAGEPPKGEWAGHPYPCFRDDAIDRKHFFTRSAMFLVMLKKAFFSCLIASIG